MKDENLNKLWQTVLSGMRVTMSEGAFNTYLKGTFLKEVRETGDRIIGEVGCPSAFIKNTIDQRYLGQLGEELGRVTSKKAEVVLKVEEIKEKPTEEQLGPLFSERKGDEDRIKRANLRPDYTFDTYAVGGSNQMAFAAAQAVANKPGMAYNPLFIYGGVGVGKTHLMQSIGHKLISSRNDTVLFCSGEEFTNDLVEAIRFKTTEKIRNKYRRLKLLMIDDVQFIAGKPTVQEEFFHTFNSIQKEGGQVVMTSDKPPAEISKLEERLKSRFGAGLIVDIGPADFELRTAILLIKSKQRGINLSMEIAQLIAENVEGVRELQGFLVRLETEKDMNGKEINSELVEDLLKIPQHQNGITKVVTPSEILQVVSIYYGVGAQQLKGERRTKMIAWPRQVLMYLLRNELRLPLEEVGRLVGGRDHTTVLHGADKVRVELETNEKFKTEYNQIKKKIFMISS
jgi:chromosomal replication initiator protein